MALGKLFEGFLEIKGVKTSPAKLKILILLCDNDILTISEIQEKMAKKGDRYNYRTIWQHIQSMKGGFLEIEKREHETGKPVYVKLSEIIKSEKRSFREGLKKSLKAE